MLSLKLLKPLGGTKTCKGTINTWSYSYTMIMQIYLAVRALQYVVLAVSEGQLRKEIYQHKPLEPILWGQNRKHKLSSSSALLGTALIQQHCPFILHFGTQYFLVLPLSYSRRKRIIFTIGWSAEPTLQKSASAHCTWRNPKEQSRLMFQRTVHTGVCIGRVD